ncbi:hypothetical protein IE53DRAFT_391064 [Violaceomyces palustris]|uniref:Uncharacterized protein n=1 Tax=Violaceomyces palustris TaxID=1673888 RepID=A0ACD0NLS6_9BASI|nr:hypothetical protein IE53DRAFT_391064 [Violaceomyces palustris]
MSPRGLSTRGSVASMGVGVNPFKGSIPWGVLSRRSSFLTRRGSRSAGFPGEWRWEVAVLSKLDGQPHLVRIFLWVLGEKGFSLPWPKDVGQGEGSSAGSSRRIIPVVVKATDSNKKMNESLVALFPLSLGISSTVLVPLRPVYPSGELGNGSEMVERNSSYLGDLST